MTTASPPEVKLNLEPASQTINLANVQIVAGATPASIGIGIGTPQTVNTPPYTGSYEVTPSSSTQTLSTNGKRMTDDVVVNPIPSNYGLITWNGAVLTVS